MDAELLLMLEVEVRPGAEPDLLAFLAEAFPFYDAQGGRMVLYREEAHPGRFLEIGLYATQEEYDRVDALVREDPTTRQVLARWRDLLAAPPKVRVLRRVTLPPPAGRGPLG